MKKLKSIFISIYCSYLPVVMVWAMMDYLQTGSKAMALVAVLHGVGAGFFSFLFLRPQARTTALLPKWTISTIIMALAASYLAFTEANFVAGLLVAMAWLGWSLYLFWYSSFGGQKNTDLILGESLPDFTLYTPAGELVSRKDLSTKPTLMIFYRGNWCPLCVAQVKEISGMYQTLADMGVEVCLVSPQPEQNTQQLAARFNVPFKFLVDRDLKTAQAFGIKVEGGTPTGLEALGYDSDTVRPTILITNGQGQLIYSDMTDNYRVRPEPEAFIRIFQADALA